MLTIEQRRERWAREKQRERRYYMENMEEIKRRAREYYDNNRDEILRKARERRAEAKGKKI